MRIKVLHLISSPYGLGGAEKLLLDMAPHFHTDRFAITFCNIFDSPTQSRGFTQGLHASGLEHHCIGGSGILNLPSVLAKLVNLVKAGAYDVVHGHLIHATILTGVLSRLQNGHRTIVTRHYTRDAALSHNLEFADTWAIRRADRVVAISSAVRDDLLSQGVAAERIVTIANGIDLANFDRELPSDAEHIDLGPRDVNADYLIGSVGNLHERKDHLTLLKAMPSVLLKFPNARLVVAGEGSERKGLEDAVTALNLSRHVLLPGFCGSVSAFLNQIDLYVHPARFEPFGIALLEAMAARKGLVATRTEGVVDIVEDGVDGHLVPVADPDAMANAICRALADLDVVRRMGREGRKKVENCFRIERTVDAYEQLYEQTAAG